MQLISLRPKFDAALQALTRLRSLVRPEVEHGGGAPATQWLAWFDSGADPINLALSGVGVVLAVGSATFATVMLISPREAYIPGQQYLAIFAQPNNSAIKAAKISIAQGKNADFDGREIDYAATGSIAAEIGAASAQTTPGTTEFRFQANRGSKSLNARGKDRNQGKGEAALIETMNRLSVQEGATPPSSSTAIRLKSPSIFRRPLILDDSQGSTASRAESDQPVSYPQAAK